METHFIDLEALNNYSQKSRDLLEWIIENYDEDSQDFEIEYVHKLQELHELFKLI